MTTEKINLIEDEGTPSAMESTLRFIRDTFKRDLDRGYSTRDKVFAVELATFALGDGADVKPMPTIRIALKGDRYRAFGSVSDEQIEVVLEECLADVRERSGLLESGPHRTGPTLADILNCYSPDDTVGDYQDKIKALFGVKV